MSQKFSSEFTSVEYFDSEFYPAQSSVIDYKNLINKPQINGVELIDNIDGIKLGIGKTATHDQSGVIKVGENLKITQDGVLSVDTTNEMQEDHTKPITSAGVYSVVGNIAALLETI